MSDTIPESNTGKGELTDLFSRTISYLRLSLTDRCNLRCLYCVTEEERNGLLAKLAPGELLSYEELLRIVAVAVDMGISKVRLTGGEPLVRKGVMEFITRLAAIDGLNDIRLTTNAVLLAGYAEDLKRAGVTKVNISLDTLRPERFRKITGCDRFREVWESIERVVELGFSPVKVNMVVMRGINDDELVDFARLSLELPLQIRFIEFMPIGTSSSRQRDTYMSADEMKLKIGEIGSLTPVAKARADGPARIFHFSDGKAEGKLGFISPISHHFCDRCNRLRLTSEGRLRSCLLSDEETDLKGVLRSGGSDGDIRKTLLAAIHRKPKGHRMAAGPGKRGGDCHGRMSRIGG